MEFARALRRQARRLAVYCTVGDRGQGSQSRRWTNQSAFRDGDQIFLFFHCRRSPTFYRGCGCVGIADIVGDVKKRCANIQDTDVCVMWDGDKNIHRNIQYNTYCTDKRRCRERYKRTGHVQVYGLSSDSRRATCLHRRKAAALALRRM